MWGAGWAVARKQGPLIQAYLTPGVIVQTTTELCCYVLSKNRTDRGLAKDRLHSFWEDS